MIILKVISNLAILSLINWHDEDKSVIVLLLILSIFLVLSF